MEVVIALARPGVDTNGNVKWLEANWMRIQVTSLRMRIQTKCEKAFSELTM